MTRSSERPAWRYGNRAARCALLSALLTTGCAASSGVETGPTTETRSPVDPPATPTDLASTDPVTAERNRRAQTLTIGSLPEIGPVTGPLALRVQYPVEGSRIASRDSNFLFGTTSTGDAYLTIDGTPVPVEPNGAFIAWLAVPEPDERGRATYRLAATRGAESQRLDLTVRLPAWPLRPDAALWVEPTALQGLPERWALPDEALEFSSRGAPGLSVWVDAGGDRFHLEEMPAPGDDGAALYRGVAPAGYVWEAACGVARWVQDERPACGPDPNGGESGEPLRIALVATDRFDTLRLERELPLGLLSPETLPVARLREAPDPVNGLAGVVVGRPTPYGTYRWRWPTGTRVLVDGRIGDRLRVRLAPELSAWVLAEDAELLPPGANRPLSPVGDLRVQPAPDRLTLRLALREALPIQIDMPDERTIALTMFGALGATERAAYGPGDELLDSLRWEQLSGRRFRLWIRLRRPVWGYRAMYEDGGADEYEGPRGQPGSDPVLRLDIRRPPLIDPARPLRGIRVAVDPGHPGAGSTGPTGLFEGTANLAIGRKLAALLDEAGAVPVLIRTDESAIGLYDRTRLAREAEADLFVSIHNNALPDGVRPFGREGTSSYYYHPHARRLAELVQRGMLRSMQLRDLGIVWGNLAVARMAWVPSILTEGAFMMMPRHEAALRTPAFQEAYARGVLEGIEAFLRERAR